MTKTRSAILALTVVLLSPVAVNADLISTSFGDYELTTVTGTFNAFASDLMAQEWFEDYVLADALRDEVGFLLGTFFVGSNEYTPIFAYGGGGDTFIGSWNSNPHGVFGAGHVVGGTDVTVTWAIGERVNVPEPGTLALFGIGLAAMGLTRRRKKI